MFFRENKTSLICGTENGSNQNNRTKTMSKMVLVELEKILM